LLLSATAAARVLVLGAAKIFLKSNRLSFNFDCEHPMLTDWYNNF
jgi:hypothetical protein